MFAVCACCSSRRRGPCTPVGGESGTAGRVSDTSRTLPQAARGRGTVGGGGFLHPARASTRCRARPPQDTRSCVRTEHSPPYLVSIECHTLISRVALFPSPPHRFFRNFRGPTSRGKVLDQRRSTPPASLLAIDQKPPATDRPAPHLDLTPKISHVIRLLDHSTTATNVAIPTIGFQCLKDVRGNYVRDCWETTAQRP